MLAKTHGEKSKKVRKAKKTPASKGCPRSDVIQKLQLGEYGNKPYKARQSAYYYNAALDRFAVDTDIEAEKLRDMFYARYETILAECMKRNDMFNARATLDSMAKIFLGIRDGNQTNIQVNSDKDGGITINFGFDNNTVDGEVIDED